MRSLQTAHQQSEQALFSTYGANRRDLPLILVPANPEDPSLPSADFPRHGNCHGDTTTTVWVKGRTSRDASLASGGGQTEVIQPFQPGHPSLPARNLRGRTSGNRSCNLSFQCNKACVLRRGYLLPYLRGRSVPGDGSLNDTCDVGKHTRTRRTNDK